MMSETLTQLFVRIARSYVGLAADLTPSWDAAFVNHVGHWTLFDADEDKSSWPFQPDATIAQIAAYAKLRGALHADPCDGDIFFIKAPGPRRYARVGIVAATGLLGRWPNGGRYHECLTIEGNAGNSLERGALILVHRRRLSPARGDRFIRWTDLLDRAGRRVLSPIAEAA